MTLLFINKSIVYPQLYILVWIFYCTIYSISYLIYQLIFMCGKQIKIPKSLKHISDRDI